MFEESISKFLKCNMKEYLLVREIRKRLVYMMEKENVVDMFIT